MNDDGRSPRPELAIGADLRRQAGRPRPAGRRTSCRSASCTATIPRSTSSRLVAELVEAESVPLLPVLRYKPTRPAQARGVGTDLGPAAAGGRDRRPHEAARGPIREHLTELDAQATLKKKQVGDIPVPPKYTSADFLKSDYWRLRGKLDVPKERWVSFPHCEGEDGTLVIAWAGYDHLQLARAISAYYVDVQERLGGRDDPRLVPLLAA